MAGRHGGMSMSNSKRKMRVVATKNTPWGKRWATVTFHDWDTQEEKARWVPSFEDLHRIVQAIALCEDEKYPPSNGLEGRGLVARFLKDAVFESDYSILAAKYKLPVRCGNKIVDTNGADLDRDFTKGNA